MPPREPAELLEDARQSSSSFRCRQYGAYSFDLLVERLGTGPQVRERRNMLATELGYRSFFDASCHIRGLDADTMLSVAASLVDRMHSAVGGNVMGHFGGVVPTVQNFAATYEEHLTATPERYSADRVYGMAQDLVAGLELTAEIELHDGSANNVSTNVTHLDPRHAEIFLARAPGLESWRAATHALGHAYFAVHPATDWIDLLGVNISATEVVAFRAQTLALADVGGRAGDFLRLMPANYAKIYAERVLNEARYYRHGPDAVVETAPRPSHAIGYSAPFRPDKRLSSVDFVLAFERYFDGLDVTTFPALGFHITSNKQLALDLSCLADDIDPDRED